MQEDTTNYILMVSSNRGRYALRSPDGDEGGDLTSGQPIAVYLGGQWIPGTVEHGGSMYSYEDPTRRVIPGYFFASGGDGAGGQCGLCQGMRVRLL